MSIGPIEENYNKCPHCGKNLSRYQTAERLYHLRACSINKFYKSIGIPRRLLGKGNASVDEAIKRELKEVRL